MAKKTSLKSVGKGIISTSKKALPVVDKGLTKVGNVAKDVAVKSAPIIENGVSVVYGTMATGLDLGVKGIKNISNRSRSASRSASRSRSLSGGRRTRRHRRH